MGYILYTQSGIFNPLDHNLAVGDMLNVVVVGGGAGGAGGRSDSSLVQGAAGSPSSFGSLVTAPGGTLNQAILVNYCTVGSYTVCYGECGADGYLPGVLLPMPAGTRNLAAFMSAVGAGWDINNAVGITYGAGDVIVSFKISTPPRTAANGAQSGGTYSYSNNNPWPMLPGLPGRGYGAGGGAAAFTRSAAGVLGAGNAGQIVDSTIKLTDTNSIAVTVGTGGAGGSLNAAAPGGRGANGCVAVFW